jgi:hypothetical protein
MAVRIIHKYLKGKRIKKEKINCGNFSFREKKYRKTKRKQCSQAIEQIKDIDRMRQ